MQNYSLIPTHGALRALASWYTFLVVGPTASAAVVFSLIDLGAAGLGGSGALDINESSVVTGSLEFVELNILNAYTTSGSGTIIISGADNNRTQGIALNDDGDVLYLEGDETRIYRSNGSYSIGIPAGFTKVEGKAINNSRQAVGVAYRGGIAGVGNTRAVFYDGATWVDIAAENGFADTDSLAVAINDAGEIVGGAGFMSGAPPLTQPFIYSGQGVEFLELPTGFVSGIAMAINNFGAVTGTMWTPTNERHSFLYADGLMTDLGPAFALAINDSRQIVGTLNNRAVLYDPISGIQDLTLSLDVDPGFVLQSANGINNLGQIVGYSNVVPGSASNHAYVLNPIGVPMPTYNIGFSNPPRRTPETGGNWIIAIAAAGIAFVRRAICPN